MNKCVVFLQVNVLMHTQPMLLTTSQLDMIENINEAEEFENSDGGALWDIFRQDDIFKLESYLTKHFKEFRHVNCSPVEKVM